MDDSVCPRCKTTKYRNPSMILLVNVCGHTLCENCVELLFVKGSGSCPSCQIPLRRNNYRVQLFEDSQVDKEVEIRKRILRDYNKREEDFDSLNDYNNYLEEIETLIFNLVNNIDIAETNKEIEQYKRENRELIIKNRGKLGAAQYEIERVLEEEKARSSFFKKVTQTEEVDAKRRKIQNHEALIDELTLSESNAANILSQHVEALQRQRNEMDSELETLKTKTRLKTEFSSGIRIGSHDVDFKSRVEEGEMYTYHKVDVDNNGPVLPEYESISHEGYVVHVRKVSGAEKAGGFLEGVACYRALHEAFCGLYFESPTNLIEIS